MGVLDFLLGWMLNMPLWLGLLIFTFVMTILVNIVHKYTTDQKEMKRVRKRLKSMQAEMKKSKDNPKKLQKLNSEAMSLNGTYMKMSFRPLLFTFIPLIIIFGWMTGNLALAPLAVGETVALDVQMDIPARVTLEVPEGVNVVGNATRETIEKRVSWRVSADEAGSYDLTLRTQDGEETFVPLTVGAVPEGQLNKLDGSFKSAEIGYQKSMPFGPIEIFGYTPGWLFTYMLFSFAFNFAIRKVLDIA